MMRHDWVRTADVHPCSDAGAEYVALDEVVV
jgi:hypothetical protein